MGFRVTQLIESHNHGELSEFYVRIENIIIDRIYNEIIFTAFAFPTKDSSKDSYPKYKEEEIRNFVSNIIGGEILYNEQEISYPTFWTTPLLPIDEEDNLYPQLYEIIKMDYANIFGSDNIIDEI